MRREGLIKKNFNGIGKEQGRAQLYWPQTAWYCKKWLVVEVNIYILRGLLFELSIHILASSESNYKLKVSPCIFLEEVFKKNPIDT